MTSLLIAIVVVAVLIGTWAVSRTERLQVQSRFVEREPVSVDEFVRLMDHPHISADRVAAALEDLESIYGLPQHVLRPSDRFSTELKSTKGSEFDSPASALQLLIKNVANERGIDPGTLKIESVQDYIVFRCFDARDA